MASALDLQRLNTVQLVTLTPFSPDGMQVLADRLEPFAADMADAGVRVFITGAGTGEFHSLTVEESAECVAAVRRAVSRDVLVIAAIGMGLPHALAAGRLAIQAGADALLVMPPIHPYLCDSGLREYFSRLMSQLPVPFLFYKRGPFPSERLLLELAEQDQVVGIKYAHNDVNAFAEFAAQCNQNTVLSCGIAERYAPAFMMAGATAYTSGVANLCPRLSLTMHRALAIQDYAQAMRRLRILRPIEEYRARQADSFNISMLKYALGIVGYDFGPVRPPMRTLTAEEQQEVRALLEPILDYEAGMTHTAPY